MADRDIQVLIRLKDEISAAIKQSEGNVKGSLGGMKTSADGVTAAFTKIAGAVAALGLAWKAYEFGKRGIAEFQEQATASAKLTSVLGLHSVALEKLSESMSRTSTFRKHEITETEAVIARYAKSEQGIKLLLPAVLKLASVTGDVTSAARLVGTTIDSNMNSLKRYGIEAHGAAGSTERFDSVIKSINSTLGDAAKAQYDALGPLGQLKKMSDEAAESFASGLIPSLQELAKTVLGQQGSIEEMAKTIGTDLGEGLKFIATIAKDNKGEIKSFFSELYTGIKELGSVIGDVMYVAGPFGTVLAGLWNVTSNDKTQQAKGRAQLYEAFIKAPIFGETTTGATASPFAPSSIFGGTKTTEAKGAFGGFSHGTMAGFSGGGDLGLKVLTGDKVGKAKQPEDSNQGWYDYLAKSQKDHLELMDKFGEEQFKKSDEIQKRINEKTKEDKKKSFEEMAKMQFEYESPEGKIKSEAAGKISQVTMAKDQRVISAQTADKLIRQIEKKRDEDLKKEKAQAFMVQAQLYAGMAEKVIQIGNNIATVQMNNVEADKKAQTDAVEHSNMSAKAKAKKIEEINKQAMAKEREIKKEQQGWSIAQAIISGAVGVMQGYAQYGPIVGTIMAVLTAAVTASEIAVIASQKFAGGGVVQQKVGRGGTDSEPAMLTPGEVVLRPDQFAALRGGGGSTTTGHTHYHLGDINIGGNASQSTVNQIRQSQVEQVKALKRTMQQANRLRQAAA